ncbi:hypothetical protein E1281_03375 [Actinomadura sp. KC345]|uniref:hypothetical protein n=1 Tax=Actinomadura sp. KC345 TaxID=2530371 RepID=UPI00104D5294|nr:hypothetical protein [Actinomadura sp. KC345]TDC57834.1 hypothetical protein E1281_03375 [Actinomadura sp. KC345]
MADRTPNEAINTLLDPEFMDLISLPPPRTIISSKSDVDLLYRVAQTHFRLWVDLTNGDYDINIDEAEEVFYYCSTCTDRHHFSRDDAVIRAIMVAGNYYTFASHLLVTLPMGGYKGIGLPGASASDLTNIQEREISETGHVWSQRLLENYVSALQCARLLYLLRRGVVEMRSRLDDLEVAFAHSLLGVFHVYQDYVDSNGFCKLGPDAQYLIRYVLSYAMHLNHTVYHHPANPWNESHTQGAFSALRLPELQLIAERRKLAVDRYGIKNLEKIFEHQLALLVQSFGFYVVGTRIGERTIDLVCISGDPSAPFSFLLEAKTSSSAYSLPAKDERALLDYINESRMALTTSPPLAFVLVVGPSPSKTLKGKLKKLEAKAGIPVRFCVAQELATLRENLVGPTPIELIRRKVIEADYLVTREDLAQISRAVDERKAAQASLIRAFMSTL